MAKNHSPCSFDDIRPSALSREGIMKAVEAAPKLQGTMGVVNVAKICDALVVKYGTDVHLCEARNMALAATIPDVRLPGVHDAWEVRKDVGDGEDDEDGQVTTYIVMDYLPGSVPSHAWPSLDSHARGEVYRQIQYILGKLHECILTRPGPIGGGVSTGFYFTQYGAGPFASSDDMESWFDKRLQVCKDFHRAPQDAPGFSGRFQDLVLCHTDLHSHNLILVSDMRIWFIDWASAGAYPKFFEEAHLTRNYDKEHPDFTKGLLKKISVASQLHEIKQLDSVGFAVTTGALCQPSKA